MNASLRDVLQLVESEFPADMLGPDGTRLARHLLVMDGTPSRDSAVLRKLLQLLDTNLGAKYESCRRLLYDNARPWKENKMQEMRSKGLIYVIYYDKDADLPGREPQLFLSFMTCHEWDIVEQGDQHPVLYLYEIQIRESLRGRGLGRRLLLHLLALARLINQQQAQCDPIFCLELTVFGDNENAIKLYRRVGGKLTFGSPKVEIKDHGQRMTRLARKNAAATAQKGLAAGRVVNRVIPAYFTFYIPLEQDVEPIETDRR